MKGSQGRSNALGRNCVLRRESADTPVNVFDSEFLEFICQAFLGGIIAAHVRGPESVLRVVESNDLETGVTH